MHIEIKVRMNEKSSLSCERQLLPWEKKNFRVGDLILLYWYNYIDLKVIKSSDIPVISGVVYDLGFCPKHAFMARINVREVGDTPTLQAGRPQSHPGLLQPPTLYICRTFRFALGHRNRTGSTLGAGHKVSSSNGVHYPGGKPCVLPDSSHPARHTWGRTLKVLPAMNISMDNCKAHNTLVTIWTLPGFGWVGETHCAQSEPLLPCSVTEVAGPGGHPPPAIRPGLGCGCITRDLTNLTFPIFNVCPIFISSCVPANAFIPVLWHKPCFYTEGNTASWFCTLTFSNSDSNARQNF